MSSLLLLSPEDLQQVQAGAFMSLLQHLQERSDSVSNIELMTIGGFCRNCLAKWMVMEARRLARLRQQAPQPSPQPQPQSSSSWVSLQNFSYDDAAYYVYGNQSYADWKRQHQKVPATPQQLQRYEAAAPLRAVFTQYDNDNDHNNNDKNDNDPKEDEKHSRSNSKKEASPNPLLPEPKIVADTAPGRVPLSNVCCEDLNEDPVDDNHEIDTSTTSGRTHNNTFHNDRRITSGAPVASIQPPPIPARLWMRLNSPPPSPKQQQQPLRIGILACSDRAYRGEYATGDLSTPAVERQVRLLLHNAGISTTTTGASAPLVVLEKALVPDDTQRIVQQLEAWSQIHPHNSNSSNDSAVVMPMHLILTTGGTGLAPRDVTPEATRRVLDVELSALMPLCLQLAASTSSSSTTTTTTSSTTNMMMIPLAALSRAVAGVVTAQGTIIANLPGAPEAIEQVLPLALPLLLQALVDVQEW